MLHTDLGLTLARDHLDTYLWQVLAKLLGLRGQTRRYQIRQPVKRFGLGKDELHSPTIVQYHSGLDQRAKSIFYTLSMVNSSWDTCLRGRMNQLEQDLVTPTVGTDTRAAIPFTLWNSSTVHLMIFDHHAAGCSRLGKPWWKTHSVETSFFLGHTMLELHTCESVHNREISSLFFNWRLMQNRTWKNVHSQFQIRERIIVASIN